MSRTQKKNRTLLWMGVMMGSAALVVGIFLAVKSSTNTQENTVEEPTTLGPIEELRQVDWVKGGLLARLTLIEYSDFQCPACKAYYPIMKQIEKDYADRVRIVYRHYPLRSIHENADAAARAAEAAGKQKKFWEMHDLLFERQEEWSKNKDPKGSFLIYAASLELDRAQFQKDLESKEVTEKVNGDAAQAQAAKLQGTPSFFLNGKKIDNPRGYGEFKKVIDDALASQ